MIDFHVDRAVESVNKIVDCNRCAVCDKADGDRVRYPCGHAACDDCTTSSEDCPVCVTPPQVSASAKPDNVFTQRVTNAASLLKACEDLFKTDVYKRQRLSEQLRIEKEVFPQCIQAPIKYENKRKSIMKPRKNKENKRSYLGEEVSFTEANKMENSVSYVQQWLNRNERKPFADLNVNCQAHTNINNIQSIKTTKDKINKPGILFSERACVNKNNRKRSYFKTTIRDNVLVSRKRSLVQSPEYHSKKTKDEHFEIDNTEEYYKKPMRNENDESGIVIDDDPVVIDDSQESAIDKDRNAWLAVLEADKQAEIQTTSTRLEATNDFKENSLSNNYNSLKVPFYKKSSLVETCEYCKIEQFTSKQPKDVKVTIESGSFITTVHIFNSFNSSTETCKKSVLVQTNINEAFEQKKDIDTDNLNNVEWKELVQTQADDTQSVDLFADDARNVENMCKKVGTEKQSLVIEESDSDVDIENSGPMQVTVDIHRSHEELGFGILTEVANQEKHCARPRRAPRGYTPTSTDSSEKENYNPNRLKKNRTGKKKYMKK